eukprot:2591991-Alexandrium_andersonii.AAC.1
MRSRPNSGPNWPRPKRRATGPRAAPPAGTHQPLMGATGGGAAVPAGRPSADAGQPAARGPTRGI